MLCHEHALKHAKRREKDTQTTVRYVVASSKGHPERHCTESSIVGAVLSDDHLGSFQRKDNELELL